MILELNNIYKEYYQGDLIVPVLSDINFEIDQGEYCAIMGPSGSGKSTLMNLVGCLDVPTSGTILLDNVNISEATEDEKADIRLKKIGFIFQQFQLLPKYTAIENVELPLTYAGIEKNERKKRARMALERVGLANRVDFYPSQLSGGQKQRVAIARAIVNNPIILLADEPTGALDSKSGYQIMELFKSLNNDGVSILMITHDLEIAERANRIIVIRDGVIHED